MIKYIFLVLTVITTIAANAIGPFNGLLLNIEGKPVRGAKIYVQTPRDYTKSDKDGKFGLTDVNPTDTLHIVISKKEKYDVPVNGSTGMKITIGDLNAIGQQDDELVKIGSGYVKRREYLGRRSGYTHEQLAATGESDLIKAMIMIVPGMQYSSRSHLKPGNTVDFVSTQVTLGSSYSINAGSSPLWIVDGSESTAPPELTVMEVERVDVFKDGAGYGTRGANGVIVITLKSGD